MGFRGKIKESEKIQEYLDLAREPKFSSYLVRVAYLKNEIKINSIACKTNLFHNRQSPKLLEGMKPLNSPFQSHQYGLSEAFHFDLKKKKVFSSSFFSR